MHQPFNYLRKLMPIIHSAKIRARQTVKRTARLKPYKSQMFTLVKNIKKLVEDNNIEQAKKILSSTFKAIDLAAKKNIIHKKNASRKKSLVQKMINNPQKTLSNKTSKTKAAAPKSTKKTAAPKSTEKPVKVQKDTTTQEKDVEKKEDK